MDSVRKLVMIASLPAAFLTPLLLAPIPTVGSYPREIASYFQASAFARYPVASYTYLTPIESYSSLHLHSVISSPFVASGWVQGGRFVSLIAAVGAAILLGLLARDIYGNYAMIFAPALLWVQPPFQRFAARSYPEALSIALTVGAVWITIRTVEQDIDARWATLMVCLLIALGITNHMWEAHIVLPVVGVFGLYERYRAAASVALSTLLTVGFVFWVNSHQPSGASTLFMYGLHNDPSLIFSLGWWFAVSGFHPQLVVAQLLRPVAAVALLGTAIWWYRERTLVPVLLSLWYAAGLAIPVALAEGAHHWYYSWGLIAPTALLGAIILTRIKLFSRVDTPKEKHVVTGCLVTLAVVYAIGFGIGVFGMTTLPVVGEISPPVQASVGPLDIGQLEDYEAMYVGMELNRAGVHNPDRLTFTGNWHYNETKRFTDQVAAMRVLIYSKVIPKEHSTNGQPDGISWGPSQSCDFRIHRTGGEIRLVKC